MPGPVPNIPRRTGDRLVIIAPAILSRTVPLLFHTMSHKFPKVQGGGSLIVAWQAKEKNIVVVGGGEVSIPPPQQYIYIYAEHVY